MQPSPLGTKWGLGGTCVNVGCIPKKMMHQAALLGEGASDAESYGWDLGEKAHRWERMVENVQMHIKSLNFAYRSELMSENVKYLNAYAAFKDAHTVECTDKKGAKTELTAARFVIATGGRPRYPDIPGGREHTISSDDLFSLAAPPGKTLCIGASYISLECAGFIQGLGMEASVLMRSIPLRGFDVQMAGLVKDYMESHGTAFIQGAVPTRVEPTAEGRKKVSWQFADGSTGGGEYDTVLVAIGRDAETAKIGLHNTGVQTNPANGKIVASGEQTSVPHIYAIGDILDGRPELTPVAVQAGSLLVRRLYAGEARQMDYELVPTTVFTPLEYATIGLSEEDAIAKLGEVRAARARCARPCHAWLPTRAAPPARSPRAAKRGGLPLLLQAARVDAAKARRQRVLRQADRQQARQRAHRRLPPVRTKRRRDRAGLRRRAQVRRDQAPL